MCPSPSLAGGRVWEVSVTGTRAEVCSVDSSPETDNIMIFTSHIFTVYDRFCYLHLQWGLYYHEMWPSASVIKRHHYKNK